MILSICFINMVLVTYIQILIERIKVDSVTEMKK